MATGGRVKSVRRVTPNDYRLLFEPHEGHGTAVVFVRPQATAVEQAWCAAVREGLESDPWVDLRRSDRIVVGGGL
jgi:hypothetical protein